ncbi:MAG: hypothetical protein Q7S29_02015 [Candidatus Peribacter sp.]|nr:hypothetical protein [Candidatus Peribacter sp.]
MGKRLLIVGAFLLLISCAPIQQEQTNEVEKDINVPKQQEDSQDQLDTSNENATVHGFYTALSQGNGNLAVRYLMPEKREIGNFTSQGITNYYGGLEGRVSIDRVEQAGVNVWRVIYSYKETGKERCTDIADVSLVQRGSQWLIGKILPQQVCKADDKVVQEAIPNSDTAVGKNIECQTAGRQKFQDKLFADGDIRYVFFYSPSLDTCLLERKDSGPGDAFAAKLYNMFTNEMLVHYSTGGTDFCEGAKATGVAPRAECTTSMEEFNTWKAALSE